MIGLRGITYNQGAHQSQGGFGIKPVTINSEQVTKLEEVLGKSLTEQQISILQERCNSFRTMKYSEKITRSAVLATLKSFKNLDKNDVMKAFKDADEISQIEIEQALRYDLGLSEDELNDNLEPHHIFKASDIAFRNFKNQARGTKASKGYQFLLAGDAYHLWKGFGGNDLSIWYKKYVSSGVKNPKDTGEVVIYFSPLLKWTSVLFEMVDGRHNNYNRIKALLQNVAAKEKNSSDVPA